MQRRTARAGALRRWESLWLQQRRRKRAHGGVRVAVPPASIANMVLWLDAGSLSLGDLDPVDTWFDGSGQGNDVYQDSASAYPTYVVAQINGQPVVRFDGVDDSLFRPSSASLALTQATIFVVRNAETWAAALSVAIEESVDEEFLVFDQAVVHHSIAYNYAELYHQDSHPGYFLQVGRYGTAPTALESFLNGVASTRPVHVVGDPVEYDSPERYVRVGGRAYGWQRFSGDIAEILMYSRSLSDSERIGVEEYLNQKYLLF